MNTRCVTEIVAAIMLVSGSASAQVPGSRPPVSARYVDQTNGLTLDQAIARALEHEPSLRAARSDIEVARGMRVQAGLRPNPSVSFERRKEPAGTDNLTMISVQWPLDLFRRSGRVAVTDREIEATELAVADRERLLVGDVRMRYGEVLAAVRDLTILDELVSATGQQHELLRSRVDEGGSPPLERDLLDIEVRRLESDRLLQVGKTEAALLELKRILGMTADAPLTVRETFEQVVQRESSAASVLSGDLAAAGQQRADVREAEARLGVADAKIDRAQREGRFDVSAFATYMRMDAGFPQLGLAATGALERVRGLFHYASAGAMVTMPLLDRNQGKVAAARAERAGAAASYDAARLTAETEIAAARTRDDHARQALKVYSASAQTLARQNLRVVAQSYELGGVTVFDVLTEQRRYLEVERAYTGALRAAYEARTALTRALGHLR